MALDICFGLLQSRSREALVVPPGLCAAFEDRLVVGRRWWAATVSLGVTLIGAYQGKTSSVRFGV